MCTNDQVRVLRRPCVCVCLFPASGDPQQDAGKVPQEQVSKAVFMFVCLVARGASSMIIGNSNSNSNARSNRSSHARKYMQHLAVYPGGISNEPTIASPFGVPAQ